MDRAIEFQPQKQRVKDQKSRDSTHATYVVAAAAAANPRCHQMLESLSCFLGELLKT
ncbi:unnamed protein product [Dovyalis caffra]|uniref:Uncharacterized protein n=1 Tax=Dovyalis caffra TaxID=77055 RepID=A0AAV1RYV3_9ROSI|nr:unnamed protein product [Dovyalis caffra]